MSGAALSAGILRRAKQGYLYLLRATFSTDIAAPLPASLPVDVGGPLATVQVDGQLSQSGGKLVFPAQATPVWGDLRLVGPGLSRAAGRAFIADVVLDATNKDMWLGFATSATPGSPGTAAAAGVQFSGSAILTSSPGGVFLPAYVVATTYTVYVILRGAAGSFLIVKGGIYGNGTLLWVENANTTATVYAALVTHSNSGTLDNFRVLDLATFATDAQVYTNRLVSPIAGATTTSTADAVIEWTASNTGGASASLIFFRKQDANNYWRIAYHATAFNLSECVAGVVTNRATDATANANGSRFVVVCEGNVIKGYVNNVLRWTYSSANNFQTQTALELNTLNGTITELICWPRTVALPGGI